jgi:hypothetical protein
MADAAWRGEARIFLVLVTYGVRQLTGRLVRVAANVLHVRPGTTRCRNRGLIPGSSPGTCGLNPIPKRCSRSCTSVYQTWTVGRSRSDPGPAVHCSSSGQPEAVWPALSAARSRATCGPSSQQTGPALLDVGAPGPAGPARLPLKRRLGTDLLTSRCTGSIT